MVRKAALIALALASGPAVAQSTQCRWIGNVWSCNQTGIKIPAPVDQAAQLAAGAALVPDLAEQDMREREMRLREREMELREQAVRNSPEPRPSPTIPPSAGLQQRYGIATKDQQFLDLALMYCRTGAPIADIPEAQRTITAALCYAYDQGRIAEIVGDKR